MQSIHSGVGCFCWAWPLFVVGSAFVCFRTKRKSGWGICGSSFVGLFLCFCLFPLLVDCCTYTATVLCTFLAFTTSTSVRTEPQATSAKPEEKKTAGRPRIRKPTESATGSRQCHSLQCSLVHGSGRLISNPLTFFQAVGERPFGKVP